MAEGEPSYIDYEAFLDPDFSPASFANSLVVATNNATDTPLDLSTPLSRVLFDLQEIDTHIHTLTSKSALPLLTHTRDHTAAASHILHETEDQISSVTQGYERLEKEVLRKWEAADEARIAAEKSLATVRLARAVARCLTLSRQLESQLAELTTRGGGAGTSSSDGTSSPAPSARDDYRTLERAATTLVSLRRMFSATGMGEEGHGLDRVRVTRTLRNELVMPAENLVKSRAQQAISRFSMSVVSAPGGGSSHTQSGYKQARDSRARLISAVTILYLLSPLPRNLGADTAAEFQPELLLSTLQGYMNTALVSSLNALTKSLSMLPSLERTLAEVSGKCQDIFALEAILSNLRPPAHPLLPAGPERTGDGEQDPAQTNLLQPLLSALDTSSLPSYFWRSLASSLASRVQEIMNRGGVSARTLRSNRDRLKREIKECVLKGSQLPSSILGIEKSRQGTESGTGNWEREAAVMVSSVVNVLER